MRLEPPRRRLSSSETGAEPCRNEAASRSSSSQQGAVGILAFFVYGAVFLAPVLERRGFVAWSQRHVVLDGLLLAPLLFLVIALATSLSLGLSIAIAIVATLVLMPIMVRVRGNSRA